MHMYTLCIASYTPVYTAIVPTGSYNYVYACIYYTNGYTIQFISVEIQGGLYMSAVLLPLLPTKHTLNGCPVAISQYRKNESVNCTLVCFSTTPVYTTIIPTLQ